MLLGTPTNADFRMREAYGDQKCLDDLCAGL